MQRIIYLSILILLAACGKRPADNRETLAVSIEPLRYVVESVAGDRYRVVTLMPKGASPETYEPTPRQMVELDQSRAVFRTGTLGFEQTKLPQLAKAAGGVQLIDLGAGITPVAGHTHSHAGAAHGHADESIDPHTWMSAKSLRIMGRNACDALCRMDPDHAADYRSRLARFISRTDSLDAQLHALLSPLQHRTFLIYHPALGYFARDYGLRQLAVEHDGKEPSAARLQVLVARCRAEGVHTVFVSEEHTGRAAHQVADAIGTQPVTINPLTYDVPAQMLHIAKCLRHD